MALDLKIRREKELLLHKAFYKTTFKLTLIYPPSKDLKLVFKEDMFMKNNKNGFNQVAYYFFNILDPIKLNKLIAGVPYDIRTEKDFHSNIIKSIPELNLNNPDADIPNIVMSHLTSSSGIKFITFMLRLSQLVLSKYLQNTSSMCCTMLLRPRPSSDNRIAYEKLTSIQQNIAYIYDKCNVTATNMANNLQKCRREAAMIASNLLQNSKTFTENHSKLKDLEKFQIKITSECQDIADIENANVKEKLESLKLVFSKVEEYSNALNLYLSSKSLELKYDKSIAIPLYKNFKQEQLNLIELFKNFIKLLDQQCFELEPLSNEDLLEQLERFQKLNLQITNINVDIVKSEKEYAKLFEDHEDGAVFLESDSGSSPLATPLPSSPTA